MMTNSDRAKEERGKYVATKIALDIEEEVWIANNGNSVSYSDKARSIFANLKNPNDQELKDRLMDGFLTAK